MIYSLIRFLLIISSLACIASHPAYGSEECLVAMLADKDSPEEAYRAMNLIIMRTVVVGKDVEAREALEIVTLFPEGGIFPRQEYHRLIQKHMQARRARTEKFQNVFDAFVAENLIKTKNIITYLRSCSYFLHTTPGELHRKIAGYETSMKNIRNVYKKSLNYYLHLPVL